MSNQTNTPEFTSGKAGDSQRYNPIYIKIKRDMRPQRLAMCKRMALVGFIKFSDWFYAASKRYS